MRTKADVRQRYGFMRSHPSRRHVDQFVVVVPCLVAVEIAFPSRDDNGGNAVRRR
jgi:hypothetical protein